MVDDSGIPIVGAATDSTVPTKHRRSFTRNVSALFGAQLVTWVMSTAVAVVVPRFVGPEAIGQYQVASSIWAVGLATVSLGTNTLVTLEVARQREQHQIDLGPALLTRLAAYTLSWLPLGAFVLIAGYGDQVRVLFLIGGATTLLATVAELWRSAFTGLENLSAIARVDVVTKIVMAVLVVCAAVVTENVRVVAVAAFVPVALSAALLFTELRRSTTMTFTRSRRATWSAIRRSVAYLAIAVVFVLYMQLDVVLMSFFVSDVEIGWYGQADVLFASALFVPTIMMAALFPRQARAHAEHPEGALGILEQGFRTLMLLAVPIGFGTAIVADQIVALLYGPEFDGTGPVLAVFGVVLMLMFETILLGQHAISTGRQNFWCVLMLVAVVMTVPLDLLFIPWTDDRFDNGAIGGAMSYVVTELMMVVAALWFLAPQLASRRSAIRLAKCLVAGGLMLAACWPLRHSALPLTIGVGAVVYPAAVVATRALDDAERAMLARLTSAIAARLRRTT